MVSSKDRLSFLPAQFRRGDLLADVVGDALKDVVTGKADVVNINVEKHEHHYHVLDWNEVANKVYQIESYTRKGISEADDETEIDEPELWELMAEQIAATNKELELLRERIAQAMERMEAMDKAHNERT